MIQRLQLNHEKTCFKYKDPEKGTIKECGGMMQIQIGVSRDNHKVNHLPFLPIKIQEKGSKDKIKTFRGSCLECVRGQNKNLCQHEMSKRIWRGTYTLEEVAYAVVELKYELVAIEEALIYPEKAYIFSDFMKILASKKIRYGTVPKQYQSNLSEYCEEINKAMGFQSEMDKLSPRVLEENPYQCAFIKGLMNMGKTHS